MSESLLDKSLAFHFATHLRLVGAYRGIAEVFHLGGFDVWHRPDGSAHPARFSFGRRAKVPAPPDDTQRAAAWMNVREQRFVISGGLPADLGLAAIRGHFPEAEFPRQPDSQNIKIAIEPGIAPEALQALNQRLAQALSAIPDDSFFVPRPGHACFWPEDYV